MGLFDWLLGKKEPPTPSPPARSETQARSEQAAIVTDMRLATKPQLALTVTIGSRQYTVPLSLRDPDERAIGLETMYVFNVLHRDHQVFLDAPDLTLIREFLLKQCDAGRFK